MFFIFGMMVGSMLSGSPDGQRMPALSLGEIPFRCFVALDRGDDDYRKCRRLSLAFQMTQQYEHTADRLTGVSRDTIARDIDSALSLEIDALRQMEAAAKLRGTNTNGNGPKSTAP